jgi:putative hydrolase of the HAD superfamily
VRALIFDLDDTLLVDEEVSHEALRKVALFLDINAREEQEHFIKDVLMIAKKNWQQGPCYSFCSSIGISAMECLWGHFHGEREELRALRTWALAYRQGVFHEMLTKHPDAPKIAEKCVALFEHERRARQRLFTGTSALLRELAKNYHLGLLTNGAPDLQREKLSHSGLEPLFSAVIISGDHGIGKPQPLIFQKMLDQLRVSASEAIMIGNSLERDIAGAHASGIASVWMDLGVEEEKELGLFDFRITELSELLAILQP